MEELVANLKPAMADAHPGEQLDEPGDQGAALEKLERMDVMVGYPDKWRDYCALEIKADDLYGNVKRASRFNADYALSDLGKPVDRKKWGMNPQTVNAYNGGRREQDRLPGGHPAAALLRSQRRRRGELRRDRRSDRP